MHYKYGIPFSVEVNWKQFELYRDQQMKVNEEHSKRGFLEDGPGSHQVSNFIAEVDLVAHWIMGKYPAVPCTFQP